MQIYKIDKININKYYVNSKFAKESMQIFESIL